MRRQLLSQLPRLTQVYGLRPWDLDRMTYREVSEYLVQLDKALSEQPTQDN